VKVLMVTKRLAEFANVQSRLREMVRMGVDLTVVSPRRWTGSEQEFRSIDPDGYRLVVTECWFTGTRSLRLAHHLHFYPHVSGILAQEKWDVIHIDEEPFNFVTYHTLTARRRKDAQVVFTTWQNLMKRYPPPFNFFEKYVFQHSAGAIAGNTEAVKVLRRRGFQKLATYVPQLGVDTLLFRKQDASEYRAKLGLRDAFLLGFVGRLSPEKGIDTLIRALARVSRECVLVVVGSGPEQRKLEAVAEGCGVSSRIRWVPWVSSADIPGYMNSFDVLVLPSRTLRNLKEQFGRVLVEAMACETCVIGSDAGAIPDVIGEAGLLFHEGDASALACCLSRVVEDPSLRGLLAKAGRERALSHFSYNKIARDTIDFYGKVCPCPA
jgi:glycosyltransferase involved in cell wall biosynthesis